MVEWQAVNLLVIGSNPVVGATNKGAIMGLRGNYSGGVWWCGTMDEVDDWLDGKSEDPMLTDKLNTESGAQLSGPGWQYDPKTNIIHVG